MAMSSSDSFGMRESLLVKGIGKGLSLKRVDKVFGGTLG